MLLYEGCCYAIPITMNGPQKVHATGKVSYFNRITSPDTGIYQHSCAAEYLIPVAFGHAAFKHETGKGNGGKKSDQTERDGDVDIEIVAGFDPDDGDEADHNAHQHVERDNAVRKGRPDHHPVAGDEKRQGQQHHGYVNRQIEKCRHVHHASPI